MKKIFIISLAVVGLLTACDPAKQETLTYNEDGRTLFGTPPETAVESEV